MVCADGELARLAYLGDLTKDFIIDYECNEAEWESSMSIELFTHGSIPQIVSPIVRAIRHKNIRDTFGLYHVVYLVGECWECMSARARKLLVRELEIAMQSCIESQVWYRLWLDFEEPDNQADGTELFRRLCVSGDAHTRAFAAFGLGQIGCNARDEEVFKSCDDVLHQLLGDADHIVRETVEEAILKLRGALKRPNPAD